MMSQQKITTDPARLAPESEPAERLHTQPWRRTTLSALSFSFLVFYSFFCLFFLHLKQLIVIISQILFAGLDCPVLLYWKAPQCPFPKESMNRLRRKLGFAVLAAFCCTGLSSKFHVFRSSVSLVLTLVSYSTTISSSYMCLRG